ncbi:GNAT family N-acetyltransferase [Rhodococcus sp. HM1]|uniref:GNAT family N-acetyltransferase n=1 Tax=unclassified Rhodococcus (in: high G+C Gram-positive bacteria) TaxID=192944 RepID=UPI0018CD14F0|nr:MULTISPECIES: GNAT family N-acetyltransferase [unclassified Rhodococcus (in: high G+C Gram-positive bacteria)]MBH0120746.1 GNAT family N-acetyltransferase [Rhodococcus sp. CX]MCK8673547.1 GNAT family N-acetyltransferase [Rhodococcus sp. HM1]
MPGASDEVIRRAVPAEAEALADLQAACWDDAYTGLIDPAILAGLRDPDERARRIETWRTRAPNALVVELPDGSLAGFATSGPPDEPDAPTPLQLYALYVRGSHWGLGYGRRLLDAALGAQPAHLWVLETNIRAQRFYAHAGFGGDGHIRREPVGTLVRWVRD